MSTTEMWDDILKDKVEKNDSVWKDYVDKAADFDVRMVDEWNKTVDVLLVFVGLFISILTSFIGSTFPLLQRDPADITNDLLVATYNQLVAQSNNISIPPVDPRSYFNLSKAEYDAAVTQNTLLFLSLSLSIIVSALALLAKLWLVSYSHQVSSVGSSYYDGAMRRQEAYNGALVWKLGGVINMLPFILLIALYLFGFNVYTSVWTVQASIAHAIGALLGLGLLFFVFTSLIAAFVPGCPFRSAFSDFIRFIFETLRKLSKRIPCKCLSSKRLRWLWIGTLVSLWVASIAAVSYASLSSPSWFILFFPLACVPIAYSTLRKAVHKPQKYKVSLSATLMFLFGSVAMILAIYIDSFDSEENIILLSLALVGLLAAVSACWIYSKMSKSMADTGEVDAIAWLLITTPQYPATLFKKAGQMTGVDSIGRHYRPRLLESLIPLLTPIMISHRAREHHSSDTDSPQPSIDNDQHLEDLEIHTACLARLSDFTDYKGTFCCLREDAMWHPKLEEPLIKKLVELVDPQHDVQNRLRGAAAKILSNYKLDIKGNPLESPTTVLESVANVPRDDASSMSNDNGSNSQEQGYLDPAMRVEREKIEEVKSEGWRRN